MKQTLGSEACSDAVRYSANVRMMRMEVKEAMLGANQSPSRLTCEDVSKYAEIARLVHPPGCLPHGQRWPVRSAIARLSDTDLLQHGA